MSKLKYKITPIHEKAIRLLEGGVVKVDGHFLRALRVDNVIDECLVCEMDCLCYAGSPINQICAEVTALAGVNCVLYFAYRSHPKIITPKDKNKQ